MMVLNALRRGSPRLAALIHPSVDLCAARLLGCHMNILVMQRRRQINDKPAMYAGVHPSGVLCEQ